MASGSTKQGKGGGARKYGRKLRRPSHKGQVARTAANKRRNVERQMTISKAAERRMRETYITPLDAEIRVADLPAKERRKYPFDIDEYGKPIMVADPKRGIKMRSGPKLHAIIEKRIEQKVRVNAKRIGRQNFSKLDASLKREHRRAGAEHRTPKDLL